MAERDPQGKPSETQGVEIEVCEFWAETIIKWGSDPQALRTFEEGLERMQGQNHYDLSEALTQLAENSEHLEVKRRAAEALESLDIDEEKALMYELYAKQALSEAGLYDKETQADFAIMAVSQLSQEGHALEALRKHMEKGGLQDRSSESVAMALIQIREISSHTSVRELAQEGLNAMKIPAGRIAQLNLLSDMRNAEDGDHCHKIFVESIERGYLKGNTDEIRDFLLQVSKTTRYSSIKEAALVRFIDLYSGEMIGSETIEETPPAREDRVGKVSFPNQFN